MSDPVSRETPPSNAAGVFASRLSLAEAFVDLLATQGVERGLIGPREVGRLWPRHIMNCAVVTPRVPEGASVADVGSGAGLPGLVWAIARADVRISLVEPLLRRTTFLELAVEELGLTNVEVVRSRAEDVTDRFDVVTARAVARLDKLARWCLPLVSPDGSFLAFKGRSAQAEVDEAKPTLHRLGARTIVVTTFSNLDEPTTIVDITR